MPLEAGDMVRGLVAHVQERVNHARKHLDMVEADLQAIRDGHGLGDRLQSINSAVCHCDIINSDMELVKITLQS